MARTSPAIRTILLVAGWWSTQCCGVRLQADQRAVRLKPDTTREAIVGSARQLQSSTPTLPEVNPYSPAEDVEAGRKLYIGRCGHCHGLGGEGGRGAVLNAGDFHHAGSDRDLFLII